jgi:hypothetical protein
MNFLQSPNTIHLQFDHRSLREDEAKGRMGFGGALPKKAGMRQMRKGRHKAKMQNFMKSFSGEYAK